jgi:branched-chain amino acid transport system ATP-binding protein
MGEVAAEGGGVVADVIAASDLRAGYGQIPVLKNVNLRVGAGEVVVLLGANGAGKTTTLLTLAGVIRPSGGTVRWLGTPTSAPLYRRARQGLRFIGEERAIIPSLTVRENLLLGGCGLAEAAELFPALEPLRDRQARLLSGGEQQMLGVAWALTGNPRALLADELSLGLAPMITERLLLAIRESARTRGTAVLLVEQQVRQALPVADRGYVLQRGEVVLEGTGPELLDQMSSIESTYLSGLDGYEDGSIRR